MLPRNMYGLRTVADPELGVDLAQVPFHGIRRQKELLSHGKIRMAFGQALNDLQFPG